MIPPEDLKRNEQLAAERITAPLQGADQILREPAGARHERFNQLKMRVFSMYTETSCHGRLHAGGQALPQRLLLSQQRHG
jgi:hypothetical protein